MNEGIFWLCVFTYTIDAVSKLLVSTVPLNTVFPHQVKPSWPHLLRSFSGEEKNALSITDITISADALWRCLEGQNASTDLVSNRWVYALSVFYPKFTFCLLTPKVMFHPRSCALPCLQSVREPQEARPSSWPLLLPVWPPLSQERPIKVIYAYGLMDELAYHEQRRGTRELNLLNYIPRSIPSTSSYFDMTIVNVRTTLSWFPFLIVILWGLF